MLKKLLKHDLVYMYKKLFIFYGLSIITAIFTRLFAMGGDMNILVIITGMLDVITFILIVCSSLVSTLALWLRFKSNIYGDESYLTHTLPVTRNQLYTSKFLTSVIITLSSLLVMLLTALIAFPSFGRTIKEMINIFTLEGSNYMIFIIYVVSIVLGYIHTIQLGYTGLILGHRSNNNKLMMSIVFGFVAYSITQVINFISMLGILLLNSDIRNYLFAESNPNQSLDLFTNKNLLGFMLSILILYVVYVLGLYLFNRKMLKKGVNVE